MAVTQKSMNELNLYEKIAKLESMIDSLTRLVDLEASQLKRLNERLNETQIQVNALNRLSEDR